MKAGALLLMALFSSGVTTSAFALKHGAPRTQPIDLVVIHSTGGPTCDEKTGAVVWVKGGTLVDNLREIERHPRLGIHYMIDRDGTVAASVPESRLAHHVFTHSGRSIAIELVNDGDGRDPFPEAQLSGLIDLLKDIARRRGLGPAAIKRHSDLDTGTLPCARNQRRKVDPGDAFPYRSVLERTFESRE